MILKARSIILIIIASLLTMSPASAAMNQATLEDYALNQIYFVGNGADNHCTSAGGDCYIAGNTCWIYARANSWANR